ncbi:hypothetical protein GOBAR_AA13044 [Gossypium barbadense]|uniref:Uncharacterized protein n=1 Tax=Gossypium barbadense TaxID=3634 RepID=A0A2P5XW74_GOSBA|nr:hypothetical protein GOBAR_AA13044 [Gossypium barbadense]
MTVETSPPGRLCSGAAERSASTSALSGALPLATPRARPHREEATSRASRASLWRSLSTRGRPRRAHSAPRGPTIRRRERRGAPPDLAPARRQPNAFLLLPLRPPTTLLPPSARRRSRTSLPRPRRAPECL